MSVLSQFTGGGGGAALGELKQIMYGNVRSVVQSNTITDSGRGTWIRVGQTYRQNTYPNLFAQIGFVNATIGLTKTASVSALVGAVGYSPDDDLYVFSTWNGAGSLLQSNSSLTNFNYKSVSGYVYGIAYGGVSGNQRFILVSNTGSTIYYSSNQTAAAQNTSNPNQYGVVAANANTFLTWNGVSGDIRISTNSGAIWGTVNSNTHGVNDIVWGNTGGANGTYILTAAGGVGQHVEMSTDGIRWTGMLTTNSVQSTNGTGDALTTFVSLGTANIYVAVRGSYNTSGANNVQNQTFTSTDGRYWEYRGLLPYSITSNSYFGVGGSKITAVGNGANTMLASTEWYHQQTQTSSIQHTHNHNHVHDCHDWWNPGGHHDFHCGHHLQHHTYTAYAYALTTDKHNRIYTANASVTNTPASNIYATFANCHVDHNNHIIRAIAYGYANNANYYMYGTNTGNIAVSTDGLTWTNRQYATGSNINSIIYGTANSSNTFMILGNSGSIVTMTNVTTGNTSGYVSRTTAYELGTSGWTTGAFGNANGTLTYILGGNTGNLIISNNSIQFSGMNTLANVYGVAFGNSKFVAALPNGVAKYSFDGVYWANTGAIGGTANDLYAIASDGVKFVYSANGGRVGYLFDVTGAWTNSTITTSNDHYALSYGGGLWVLGGKNGSLFTATDGITWTARTSNTTNTILTTLYANGTYFYAGDNVLATSTDAITWIRRTPSTNHNYVRISSLAYGGNANANVYVYGAQGFYGKSTDGITWTTIDAGSANTLTSAFQLGNTAVGNTNYTGQIEGLYAQTGISTGNTVFVAVGRGGWAATSNDGNTWITQNTKTGADLTDVTFGNGRFMSVGSNGTSKISPNGVLWSGHAANANIYSIAHFTGPNGNTNTFILVGASRFTNVTNISAISAAAGSGGNSNLHFVLETSNDGIYWTTAQWKTPYPPGFAVGGNTTGLIADANWGANNSATPQDNSRGTWSLPTTARTSVSNNLITWSGVGLTSARGNDITTVQQTAANIPQISFGNGEFFATGAFGIFAKSNDGIYWTTTNVYASFSNNSNYQMSTGSTAYNAGLGFILPYQTIPGVTGFGSALISPVAYKLLYHAASKMYMFGTNIITFTSQDLVNWTPRIGFNNSTSSGGIIEHLSVSGPVVVKRDTSNTLRIVYAENANNYVSAAYDVTTEFYVPFVTPDNLNYATSACTNTLIQTQSTGYNPDLVWYIKADDQR